MHDRSDRGTPARPPRRRRPHLAALVGALALTLAVAACAGAGNSADGVASLGKSGQPTATTNAGKTDPKQAALNFGKCMRQHGIDMPDPKFDANGGMTLTINGVGPNAPKPDDPKFKAAQQACQKFMPNGGQPIKPNAQQLQQALQFAKCMRQHGIDMPDPNFDASGGIVTRGASGQNGNGPRPDDPKFKAAQQACQKFAPKGPGGAGLSTSVGGGK
jgi:hypothetical protein